MNGMVRTDAEFWQPYDRKRSDRLKAKMVRQQFNELHNGDLTIVTAFVSRIDLAPLELAWIVENLGSCHNTRVSSSGSRFGAQSTIELAVESAQPIGAEDLRIALNESSHVP